MNAVSNETAAPPSALKRLLYRPPYIGLLAFVIVFVNISAGLCRNTAFVTSCASDARFAFVGSS